MNYMPNKTVCANCYKCTDVIIYMVTVTLFVILKIHYVINLLNITHYHLPVEQRHLQQTESP